MANRKLPFGYRIWGGQVQIEEHEAETVRIIFDRYIAGVSYDRLAGELNGHDVPYTPGKPWNKPMVARILQDERYVGGSAYPQIVTQEFFQSARAAKPDVSGTRNCAEIKDIRILARCGLCHGPIQRTRKNYWRCPHCMDSPASIKDEHLILCVDQLLRRLCEHPDIITLPPAVPADNEVILCAQDSFNQEMDKPEFDEDAAKSAALALASAQFNALDSSDYEAMRIQYILGQSEPCDGLDTNLLRQVASAILIHPNGSVSLQLKNHQILERSDST